MTPSLLRRPVTIVALSLALVVTVMLALAANALDDSDRQRAMAATVQVQAVVSAPDYNAPWQCRPTETFGGSGALIEGGFILTNAHVEANAVSIELRRQGLPDRYSARVEHIDHASDLALLRTDDPAFAAGVEPLPLGEMPRIEQTVNVYGYPLVAQSVCSTEGVVSRIEHEMYGHGYNILLMAQMDAGINPGSSGGPAVADGRIVGLAMQKPDDAEAAGQFIPAPVISRFLADVRDGRVDGVPALGANVQLLENASLRASLGLGDGQTGVLILEVAEAGSAAGVLAPDDVLLSVAGQPVANDGTVALADNVRVDFDWPLQQLQVGDKVAIRWFRHGAEMSGELRLRAGGALLGAAAYPDRASYRIFGGLVFQPVDMDLALSMRDELPTNIMAMWNNSTVRTSVCREPVRLGRVLPHAVNRGFELWGGELIAAVQGTPVVDFAHLNELLDGLTGRWARIDLDDGTRIMLDLAEARAALPAILEKFNVASDRYPGGVPAEVPAGAPLS
jgi:S1-C subfamily serine protease